MSSKILPLSRLAVLLAGFFSTATHAAPTATEPVAATSNLKTCVVSGGKLGGMGKPVQYAYKQAGQADRTVTFCCKGCIKKFEKEPSKYLAKLDAAKTTATAETRK